MTDQNVYTVDITFEVLTDRKQVSEIVEEFGNSVITERVFPDTIDDRRRVFRARYGICARNRELAFHNAANYVEATIDISAVGPVEILGGRVVSGDTELLDCRPA
jgi:hypothetical protein